MNKKTIIYSIKSALPVITGYIVLSIGFGLLLQDKGYGWGWAVLMSTDRKSTRLNSSHIPLSRMPSSA